MGVCPEGFSEPSGHSAHLPVPKVDATVCSKSRTQRTSGHPSGSASPKLREVQAHSIPEASIKNGIKHWECSSSHSYSCQLLSPSSHSPSLSNVLSLLPVPVSQAVSSLHCPPHATWSTSWQVSWGLQGCKVAESLKGMLAEKEGAVLAICLHLFQRVQ